MRISTTQFQPSPLASFLARVWVRLARINEQKYRDDGWNSYAEKLQFKLLKLRLRLFSNNYAGQLQRMADDMRSCRISVRVFNLCREKSESCLRRLPASEITFKHSGNAGDIIYALPAIKALSAGRPARLFLKLDVPVSSWTEKEHPIGKVGLNAPMVEFLRPLLEHQVWLSSIQIHNGEAVDYDLDMFREVPNIKGDRGDIAHWYFWMFAVSADLSQSWLEVRPPPVPSAKIVLARSPRYHNPFINYAFLRDFGEIDFVGTPSEFEEMKQTLPKLRHLECGDFLQLARVIKAARFFIGNQSFPYAVAEALKVPRILEVCPDIPNVIPAGGNTGEAFFQPNFEKLVRHFWEQTAQPIPTLQQSPVDGARGLGKMCP